MIIKEVKPTNDILEVELMAKEIWNQHYVTIIGKEQVDYMIKFFQNKETIEKQIFKENYLYYIIQDENQNAGYFAIVPNNEKKEMFLSKIYIYLNFRGKGLSKEVINYIESVCKRDLLKRIYLTVNKYNLNTIEVYKKLGFRIIDSAVFDIGNGFVMDDYVMEKII